MSYPNTNTTASDAKRSTKSEIKSDTKSMASKADRALETMSNETPKSITESLMASALAFLPAKNTDDVRRMLTNTVHDVQDGFATARDSASAFVRRYPIYSLLGAAAVGAGAVMLIKMRRATEPNSESVDFDQTNSEHRRDSSRFDA